MCPEFSWRGTVQFKNNMYVTLGEVLVSLKIREIQNGVIL